MRLWLAIGAVALVGFTLKAAGPAILADRELSPRARGVIALLAPALLSGLIVVGLLGPDWKDVDPTVLLGLAAAAAARRLRVPMLLALLVGVAVTALSRLPG